MAGRKPKFKWHHKTFEQQLHRSAPIQALVTEEALALGRDAAAGSDREAEYGVKTFQGSDRFQAHLYTANWGAMWDEQRDKMLTRTTFGKMK